MSTNALAHGVGQSEPTLIVFGRDGAGKPRASWFDAMSADLALKAADLMKMRVLRIKTDEERALALQLARGRVFATGKAFTPYTRASVFSKLLELARNATAPATMAAANPEKGQSKPSEVSAEQATQTAGTGPDAPPPKPTQPANARPKSWEEIGIGSLVLATIGREDGWWESEVLGINGETFTLKWRDWPREPAFVRRRGDLALLPITQQ
jgi:hypothetical protein